MSQVSYNPNQALIDAFNSGQHIIVKNDQITTENSIMHGLRKFLGVLRIMDSIKDVNAKLRGKMAEILQNHGTSDKLVDSMKNNTANDGELDSMETALMKHTLGIKENGDKTQLEIDLQTFSSNDTSQLSDNEIVKAKNKEIQAGVLKELRLHVLQNKDTAKSFYNNLISKRDKYSENLQKKVYDLLGRKTDPNNLDADQAKLLNMIKNGIPTQYYTAMFTKVQYYLGKGTKESNIADFKKAFESNIEEIKKYQDKRMLHFDKATQDEIRKATVEGMLDSNVDVKKIFIRDKDDILKQIDTNSDYGKALKDVLDSLYNDIEKEVKNLYEDKLDESNNWQETLKECINDFLKGDSKYFPNKVAGQ